MFSVDAPSWRTAKTGQLAVSENYVVVPESNKLLECREIPRSTYELGIRINLQFIVLSSVLDIKTVFHVHLITAVVDLSSTSFVLMLHFLPINNN